MTVKKAFSEVATGLQGSQISFGNGHFKIHSLGVFRHAGTAGPAQSVHVYMRYFKSGVAYADVTLGSGWYSRLQLYSLHNIEFEGPSLLLAYSDHLDEMGHDMIVQYKRLKP